MRMYDDKDIAIVAQVFNSIAPDSIEQRARMIVEIAKAGCITSRELLKAVERDLGK